MKPNKDIRDYAFIKGVHMWQIADALNMHDSNLSRLLRHELPDDKKAEIRAIIDQISAE